MTSPTSTENSEQFFLFKDCIARQLLNQAEQGSSSDELDDFSSYLAAESWPVLPVTCQTATYELRSSVPDVDDVPLQSISTSFSDTLISYGLVDDVDDALKFLRKAFKSYIDQATAPPPVWTSTRTKECEICEREVPLTYHHLIPRSTHGKVLKKGWHPESLLNSVAWLCRPCHSVVHHVATNEELARQYHSVKLLLEREDIQKWQKYAAKQRFGVRRG